MAAPGGSVLLWATAVHDGASVCSRGVVMHDEREEMKGEDDLMVENKSEIDLMVYVCSVEKYTNMDMILQFVYIAQNR